MSGRQGSLSWTWLPHARPTPRPVTAKRLARDWRAAHPARGGAGLRPTKGWRSVDLRSTDDKVGVGEGEPSSEGGELDLRRSACAVCIEIQGAGDAVVDDAVGGVGGGCADMEGVGVED